MNAILHDHLLALLHSGHEVTFDKTRDGDFGVHVVRDLDGESWYSTGATLAEALWFASPLHADDEPFPGEACQAVSPDGDPCTEAGAHRFHYGPDEGGGVRRMWAGSDATPGSRPGVLDAGADDLYDRVNALEARHDKFDRVEAQLIHIMVALLVESRPDGELARSYRKDTAEYEAREAAKAGKAPASE